MVLLRRKIPLLSQENIGKELNLTVPKEYKIILPKAKIGKRPISGWGTWIGDSIKPLNNFFKKYRISLKAEYFYPTQIKNINKWLREKIKKNVDIMVCFNHKRLYYNGNDGGHLSILESVKDNRLILVDPSPNAPKFREVNLAKIIKAMEYHGKERLGGFILINRK